jgi:hypothetical protein
MQLKERDRVCNPEHLLLKSGLNILKRHELQNSSKRINNELTRREEFEMMSITVYSVGGHDNS